MLVRSFRRVRARTRAVCSPHHQRGRTMSTTLIRHADWAIAWDAGENRHVYRKHIDVAFVPMNMPNAMPPEEAADAVKVFKPKVVYPFHYRQSDTKLFAKALEGTDIDVRLRNWYY